MNAHSELPWSVNPKFRTIIDATKNDLVIVADSGKRGLANAEFIVTAVNAHAALVEALQECREHFAGRADAEYFTDSASPVPNAEMTLLAVVDAALLSVRQGGVK